MDILKNFKVSFYSSGKEPAELVLYFDSGSFYTFIKRTSALKVGRLFELVEPEPFGGLGDGLTVYWTSKLEFGKSDD